MSGAHWDESVDAARDHNRRRIRDRNAGRMLHERMTMSTSGGARPISTSPVSMLGLYRLLDPVVRADPYPLYEQLRVHDPVDWAPYLKTWVVTRYEDVAIVLHDRRFSANRTPTPEELTAL